MSGSGLKIEAIQFCRNMEVHIQDLTNCGFTRFDMTCGPLVGLQELVWLQEARKQDDSLCAVA